MDSVIQEIALAVRNGATATFSSAGDFFYVSYWVVLHKTTVRRRGQVVCVCVCLLWYLPHLEGIIVTATKGSCGHRA